MAFQRDFRPQKGQCFVLMPYGVKPHAESGVDIDWDERFKEVLEPAIEAAGMVPLRADNIFGAQLLIDRVWRGIQEAEVVIADLTGLSANVMYEVGLANVIGKRLILLSMSTPIPIDLAPFVAIMYSHDGMGLLKLSRELQTNLEAARREPVNEAMLVPLPGGDVEAVPAVVEFVAESYVTVRAMNNRMGFLHPEDASYLRVIKDMRKQFRLGQNLNGSFVVDVSGESKYSLVANQDNPWPRILSEYDEGTKFIGSVQSVVDKIGAFVVLLGGVNGLIPQSQMPPGISEGDQVEATVVRIDQRQRKVGLRFERLVRQISNDEEWGDYAVGAKYDGAVRRVNTDRGYLLVSLPPGKIGLLNVNRMTVECRARFEAASFKIGDHVEVEITHVDRSRDRIILKDSKI